MSIADKLTYLQTTKQLLKTEINKINNVLDDNSTFRSYPQELFNGYLDILNNGTDTLWNNLEKVSASGEETTLENVETAPMKIELNGNTSQETTTGRNKLPTNKSDWESGHYDTYGNKSAFATRMRTIDLIPFLPNTTYSVLGTDFYIREYDSNGTFINNLGSVYNGGTFTTNSNTAYLGISINITYSDYVENINQIAIFLNSETNKTWEPYTGGQPSPSPDYPQQVKVVKGENVVSVQGENLVDIEGIELNPVDIRNYEQGNNYIKVTTKAVAWANIIFRIFLEAGTYYYKHYAFLDSEKINTSGIGSLRISPSGGGTAIVNQSVAGEYLDKINDITFTIEESGIYIFIYRCANSRDNVRILNINDIILSKTSTDYVPYSKTDYPISLGDIELCKINTYKDYFHKDSGKWYVHKEINKVVLDGTETWNLITGTDRRFYTSSSTPLAMVIEVVGGRKFGELVSNAFMCQKGYTSDLKMFLQVSNNNVNNLGFTDINSSFEDTSSVTTWLSSNNTIVYYVLATPTEEEITNTTLIEQLEAISKAKSVKDKTYITQTNEELPFILDVEAIKEYSVE